MLPITAWVDLARTVCTYGRTAKPIVTANASPAAALGSHVRRISGHVPRASGGCPRSGEPRRRATATATAVAAITTPPASPSGTSELLMLARYGPDSTNPSTAP